MKRLKAGGTAKRLGRQVRKIACTSGRIAHAAGPGLGRGNQVLERAVALGRGHHDNDRDIPERHDGPQVPHRIERQLAVRCRHDRMRRRVYQDGIAVGLGAGDGCHPNRVAAAGPVFDDDGLAESDSRPD